MELGARALRRAAVLRSCPPGRFTSHSLRLKSRRPSPLYFTPHSGPPQRSNNHRNVLGFECIRMRQRCPLPRAWGDRRSEVKEEGRIGLT